MEIIERIRELSDEEYRQFHSKLMPNIDAERIIGVRVPLLRKLAKELKGSRQAEQFLTELPHFYYEENNLHAFLIEFESDFEKAVTAVDDFLPYVDNWATCDMLNPKVFAKHKHRLEGKIVDWMSDKHTYTIRYGIGQLMRHFLDEDFKDDYLSQVAAIRSSEYYVNMMIAWYFATALAKQYEHAVNYLKSGALDRWTHNKAIQKAIESHRLNDGQKTYLRSLKR